MVISENTKHLTEIERKELEKALYNMGKRKLNQFREEFDPNRMGFAEREEGI